MVMIGTDNVSDFPQQAAALKKMSDMWWGKCSAAVFGANFQITLHCLNYLEPELLHSLLIACDIFLRCPSAEILAAAVNSKSEMTAWNWS